MTLRDFLEQCTVQDDNTETLATGIKKLWPEELGTTYDYETVVKVLEQHKIL